MAGSWDRYKDVWGNRLRVIPALAALLMLLAVRNVPPRFAPAPSADHTSIHAVASHDHRLQFDTSGLQWSDPVRFFVLLPPAVEAAHSSLTPELYSALQLKGFHYNRPPPIL